MANSPQRTSQCRATSVRRAGWATWVAAITIVVVAWAPLLGTLHQALVRHVVCEHGELIEPDERGQQHAPHVSTVTAAHRAGVDSRPSVAPGTAPSLHAHSHCSVGTLARSAATVATGSPAGALLEQDRAVSLAARDATPVRSILSSAPKTSPPAESQSSLV